MKFRDIIEGTNKSKCSDALRAYAKKTSGSETREIQVIAGKLDNYASTGNKGVIADAVKVLKQMDSEPRSKVMDIMMKHDSSMAKSIMSKMGKMREYDLEESYTKQQIMKMRVMLGREGQDDKNKGVEILMDKVKVDKKTATAMWKAAMNESYLNSMGYSAVEEAIILLSNNLKSTSDLCEAVSEGADDVSDKFKQMEQHINEIYDTWFSEVGYAIGMNESRRDAPKGSRETSNENPLVNVYDDEFSGKPGLSGMMNLQTWMAIHGVSAKYQKDLAKMVLKAGVGKKVEVPEKPMEDNRKEYEDEGKKPRTYWIELSKHHEKEMNEEKKEAVELDEATHAEIKKEITAKIRKMSDKELLSLEKKQKSTKPVDHNRSMITNDVIDAEKKRRGLTESAELDEAWKQINKYDFEKLQKAMGHTPGVDYSQDVKKDGTWFSKKGHKTIKRSKNSMSKDGADFYVMESVQIEEEN